MTDEVFIDIRGLTKTFPGVKALSDVSFQIKRGTIHALVGENGAGKSTLIKILSGVYQADGGTFLIDGEEISVTTPLEARNVGISVVHQEIKLCETLSVAENIFLGRPFVSKKLKLVEWNAQRKAAKQLLTEINADLDIDIPVGKISVAQQQMVEICKALSLNSRFIIMDEPSATLTEKELDALFGILAALKERGVTVLYISHRLEEIFKVADNVTVLRDGQHIDTLPVSSVDRQKLISMMVGRELGNEYPKESVERGEVVLETKDICRGKILRNININVHAGEIVGISGLVGAGRTELARVIFGADKPTSGEVYYKGKKTDVRNVSDAITKKIALVPEDRKAQGVNLMMSVRHNITLVAIDRMIKLGVISFAKESAAVRELIDELSISTPTEEQEVRFLSGGNQQKVVLAKWLAVDSDLLIFDEPTRGIDVGAKAEIYKLLCELAKKGKAIIMISSEMAELIGMCDRMYVMYEGAISGELDRSEFSQERIMGLAAPK